jgi:hypothetical protein
MKSACALLVKWRVRESARFILIDVLPPVAAAITVIQLFT